jgi:dCMP deaminase
MNDNEWMKDAFMAAKESPDEETQVGCVIVQNDICYGSGCNRHPKDSPCVFPTTRPGKYPYMVHAEMIAILSCKVASLSEATLYVTHSPCTECAKMIAESGVKRVVWNECYNSEGITLLEEFFNTRCDFSFETALYSIERK